MPKTYYFTEEQIDEIEKAKQKNKDKNIDKRLQVLLLRAKGIKREEVSKITGYGIAQITNITSKYQNNGLAAIVDNHYMGNHRNFSYEEEEEILSPFIKAAESGQMVSVSEILQAYEARLGRTTEKDHGRIYNVLKRHGWRKIMPRSKHPNKASDEEIESSKKLTLRSKKLKTR